MIVRSAYLGVLILALLWILLLEGGGSALGYRDLARAGATAFENIAYLQIGLICIIAPVFMAGAIAQESSPRTWDILLTTPVTPIQVVLGNLFGRLFFILSLLAASLPLFAMTQYFGGVPGRSIFLSSLIAGCAALFVGAIALALAVSRIAGRRAVFAFYIAVVSYLAITAGVDAWAQQNGAGVTWMTAINPFLSLRALLNPTGYPRAGIGDPGTTGLGAWFLMRPVTTWCLLSTGLSLVLMVLSAITVRAGGLATLTKDRSGVALHRRLMRMGPKDAKHRPPRMVWSNPIAWREAAARNSTATKTLARWLFIAIGWGFGLTLAGLYHFGSMSGENFQLAVLATVLGESMVAALVAINMASTAVSREREDGTLDLILTTPITPAMYLSGKLRGLIAYLLPLLSVPIGTLLIAGIYAGTGGFGREDGAMVSERMLGGSTMDLPVVLPESALIVGLVLVPFIAFCVVVGLLWSLRSKGTLASVIGAVGVVGTASLIIGSCGWMAGQDAPLIGPALASLSPASAVRACVFPGDALFETISQNGLATARVWMAGGALASLVIYGLIVWGVHASMVRNFDFTVRKLAGMK